MSRRGSEYRSRLVGLILVGSVHLNQILNGTGRYRSFLKDRRYRIAEPETISLAKIETR